MNVTARMTGMDALSLRTKRLIKAAQDELKLAVPDGAQIIAEEAKVIVPVLTGRLRDAIHVEPSFSGAFPQCIDRAEKQVVVVTPVHVSPGSEIGFTPPYARRIEFGFMAQDKLGRTFHQAAQPFMRPAHDTKKDEAVKQIKEQMVEALSRAQSRRSG